jgi:hypothetical protein
MDRFVILSGVCVWGVDNVVILSVRCVGSGQHCDTAWLVCGLRTALRYSEVRVWALDSIVILSVVCVVCGQHCDTEWCVCVGVGQHCDTVWCVCGLWTALRY